MSDSAKDRDEARLSTSLPSFLRASSSLRIRSDVGISLAVASWGAVVAGIALNQYLLGGAIAFLGALMWTHWVRKATIGGKPFVKSALRAGVAVGVVGVVLFHWAAGAFALPNPYFPSLAVVVIAALLSLILPLAILAVVLLTFGIPWARTQDAKAGLQREDRAHVALGAIQVAAVLGATFMNALSQRPSGIEWGQTSWFAWLLIVVTLVNSALSQLSAIRRMSNRRAWIAQAETGRIPEVTIESVGEGRSIRRVVQAAAHYRVAERHEEVLELDEEGEAFAPKTRATD